MKRSPAPSRFLYLAWLEETCQAYAQAAARPAPTARLSSLTPRQYGAALLMAYLGEFSLPELAAIVGVNLTVLEEWRGSPEFLQVMDWSKSRFARSFQEILALEDFSCQEYLEIAGEFACLEESLRVRLRTALYPQLRDLGERLVSQYQHGLSLETSWFPLFRRLLRFFWALEIFWPSAARARLREKCLPLAREVVWPALGLPDDPELSPEFWETGEFGNLKEVLATAIKKVMDTVG
jgi:hypothetical protein